MNSFTLRSCNAAIAAAIAFYSISAMAQCSAGLHAGINWRTETVKLGGVDTRRVTLEFLLLNDSDAPLDVARPSWKIVVNGVALPESGFIFGNGPDSHPSPILDPGDNIQIFKALDIDKFFTNPGEYKIYWEGDCFKSPTIAVTIRAAAGPPTAVPPVVADGIQYSATGDGRVGYVVATDIATNKGLWKARVFDYGMELPAAKNGVAAGVKSRQWVFIEFLKQNPLDNSLFVMDGNSRCYQIDLKTIAVTKHACGGARFELSLE
jgi:hypothetical protein